MQKIPRVTLIIPVFKVEEYLRECLDSIINQNFKESYRAILINDQSPDNCGEICKQYAKKHPEIFHYIENSKNVGVSASRNSGLELIQSDYFMFVDPDDILPENSLLSMYSAIHESGADIVKGNNLLFSEKNSRNANYNCKRKKLVEGDEVLTILLQHNEVRGHPWGKIFRADKLSKYRFVPGVSMAEDLLYCSEVFSNANSLLLITDVVYHYRHRSTGSTGRKYDSGAYLEWMMSVEQTEQFVKTKNQYNGFISLLVRTLGQLMSEAKTLPNSRLKEVVDEFESKKYKYKISIRRLIFHYFCKDTLKSLIRYVRMSLAVRRIKRRL